MNRYPDDFYDDDEEGREAFDAAVQETIAEKRKSFIEVDNALGSLDEADYLEQSKLVFTALATETNETFSPEALQAIGQFLCDKVLAKLEAYACEEVEEIFKR